MVEPRTRRTPSRESVSQGLDRVRQAAKARMKQRFTALLHHVSVDLLKDAYFWLKRNAAPGVDGVTWQDYAQDLEANIRDLHARVHRGVYRALPSRRKYIAKPDGRANINLHYVFELWAQRWRHHHARGNVTFVRYADDIVCGFEHEADAQSFHADLQQRMKKFDLSLHPDKTRLIEFGRLAAENRARRGLGKPETFDFLGFTHLCGRSRKGLFQLKRKSRRDGMRAKLRAIKEELRRRMHEPIPQQGQWLCHVVRGYFAYHAVPTHVASLSAFRHHVEDLWRRALKRRSQKDCTTWSRLADLAAAFLPVPRVLHPWSDARFAVTHPRWEPGA